MWSNFIAVAKSGSINCQQPDESYMHRNKFFGITYLHHIFIPLPHRTTVRRLVLFSMPNTSLACTRFFSFFLLVTQIDCQNVPCSPHRREFSWLVVWICTHTKCDRGVFEPSNAVAMCHCQSIALMNLLIEAQSKRQKLNKTLNSRAFTAKLALYS